MTVTKKIIKLMQGYTNSKNERPAVVEICQADEMAMLDEIDQFPDTIRAAIFEHGLREAVTRLFGLSVEWDAPETAVGPGEHPGL